jgi:hypothetical protein
MGRINGRSNSGPTLGPEASDAARQTRPEALSRDGSPELDRDLVPVALRLVERDHDGQAPAVHAFLAFRFAWRSSAITCSGVASNRSDARRARGLSLRTRITAARCL